MSTKTKYPPWLTAFQGNFQPANPSGHPTIRTFRMGKMLVKPKVRSNDERKNIMRAFIAQLDRALAKRARTLEKLDKKKPFSQTLREVIADFFIKVIASNDATSRHKSQRPPRTLENAVKLSVSLKEFNTSIEQLVKASAIGPSVSAVLAELAGDVEHFVRSIKITHSIVRIVEGRPKMRNRPSQSTAMAAYSKIVLDHQTQHGPDKFPKPRGLRKQMESLGFAIPERTLRDWKRQIKGNTFGHFVQCRKRQ